MVEEAGRCQDMTVPLDYTLVKHVRERPFDIYWGGRIGKKKFASDILLKKIFVSHYNKTDDTLHYDFTFFI